MDFAGHFYNCHKFLLKLSRPNSELLEDRFKINVW